MPKVILDTNVVVSSLIQRNVPFSVVKQCLQKREVEICLSEALYREYAEVLHRPKFSRYPEFTKNAQLLLTDVRRIGKIYVPGQQVEVIEGDDTDNRLLELALEAKADYLITGNHSDFKMEKFHSTSIMAPKQFLPVLSRL